MNGLIMSICFLNQHFEFDLERWWLETIHWHPKKTASGFWVWVHISIPFSYTRNWVLWIWVWYSYLKLIPSFFMGVNVWRLILDFINKNKGWFYFRDSILSNFIEPQIDRNLNWYKSNLIIRLFRMGLVSKLWTDLF